MVMTTKISLVIVAQDEEGTIGSVIIAASSLVDEIILVDSGSSDRTCEIAAEQGAKVVHQDWLGYAGQKNFAIDLASFDWVLSLDADEVFTEELIKEIAALKPNLETSHYDGYKIPRILYIGKTAITHGGFYPDAQLRLFRKNAGRFGERLVHEAIKITGPVSSLGHPMIHYAYKTLDEFAAAMDKYARLSAQEFYNRGHYEKRLNPLNEVLHPAWTWFYRYFLRLGVLDGAMGFAVAKIYSDYVRKKIVYLRELVYGSSGGS